MTPFIRNMNQSATYWPRGSTPDGFGNLNFSPPLSIKVRWQDKNELFRDEQGNEAMSSAVIYADRDLSIGGYLYLGESAVADPRTVTGAREIRQRGVSPSLNQPVALHKFWL